MWLLSGSFRYERGHSAVDMMQSGDDWYASGDDRKARSGVPPAAVTNAEAVVLHWLDVVEIHGNTTVSASRQLLPVERISEILFDVILPLAKEMEEHLRL